MSMPAIAWAWEQGIAHDLSTGDLACLLYLADLANGELECWPGQERIARFTRQAVRSVRRSVERLDTIGLIRIGKRGTMLVYRILRPVNGEDNNPKPATESARNRPQSPVSARHNRPQSPVASRQTGLSRQANRTLCPKIPATESDKPRIEPRIEPKTRAGARGSEGLNSLGGKEGSKQGPPPPAEHDPTPAEIEAKRKADHAAISALPRQLGAVFASLGHSMRHIAKPDGVVSPLDRHEQADLLRPRIKPNYAPPAYLAAARADLAARAAANQARATADSTA